MIGWRSWHAIEEICIAVNERKLFTVCIKPRGGDENRNIMTIDEMRYGETGVDIVKGVIA